MKKGHALHNLKPIGGLFLWIGAVASGFFLLADYEQSPGEAAIDLGRPNLPLVSGQATLVMLVHPHCPCSRASLAELEQIMTHCQGLLRAQVYFLRPKAFPPGWEHSDLWTDAEAIPGVEAFDDEDGYRAKEFGARTSGQVVVFDSSGQCVFSGGITGARGHQGDNLARQAVLALLGGDSTFKREFPVFGCPLFDRCSSHYMDFSSCSK
jgi:hypothetical protein